MVFLTVFEIFDIKYIFRRSNCDGYSTYGLTDMKMSDLQQKQYR